MAGPPPAKPPAPVPMPVAVPPQSGLGGTVPMSPAAPVKGGGWFESPQPAAAVTASRAERARPDRRTKGEVVMFSFSSGIFCREVPTALRIKVNNRVDFLDGGAWGQRSNVCATALFSRGGTESRG